MIKNRFASGDSVMDRLRFIQNNLTLGRRYRVRYVNGMVVTGTLEHIGFDEDLEDGDISLIDIVSDSYTLPDGTYALLVGTSEIDSIEEVP